MHPSSAAARNSARISFNRTPRCGFLGAPGRLAGQNERQTLLPHYLAPSFKRGASPAGRRQTAEPAGGQRRRCGASSGGCGRRLPPPAAACCRHGVRRPSQAPPQPPTSSVATSSLPFLPAGSPSSSSGPASAVATPQDRSPLLAARGGAAPPDAGHVSAAAADNVARFSRQLCSSRSADRWLEEQEQQALAKGAWARGGVLHVLHAVCTCAHHVSIQRCSSLLRSGLHMTWCTLTSGLFLSHTTQAARRGARRSQPAPRQPSSLPPPRLCTRRCASSLRKTHPQALLARRWRRLQCGARPVARLIRRPFWTRWVRVGSGGGALAASGDCERRLCSGLANLNKMQRRPGPGDATVLQPLLHPASRSSMPPFSLLSPPSPRPPLPRAWTPSAVWAASWRALPSP